MAISVLPAIVPAVALAAPSTITENYMIEYSVAYDESWPGRQDGAIRMDGIFSRSE